MNFFFFSPQISTNLKLQILYIHFGCSSAEDHEEQQAVANTVEQCAQATASHEENKPADGQVSSAEQPQCRVVFML